MEQKQNGLKEKINEVNLKIVLLLFFFQGTFPSPAGKGGPPLDSFLIQKHGAWSWLQVTH
jgi:hypothetical protein